MSDDNASTDSAPETGTTAETGKESTSSDGSGWERVAQETGLTPERVLRKLEHARTWETRAKENKGAADELGTLRQQMEDMQRQMAERDVADVERASRLAMSQVHARLAESGLSKADITDLLSEYDGARLLKDGQVDDEAVTRLSSKFSRFAGRPTPDPDQGRAGGGAPQSMSALIRQAAGRR